MKPSNRTIISVSELNLSAKRLLESSFPMTWVEGEISNLARPSSGHIYFSLKDSRSQVRCAMFKNRRNLLRFTPENGQHVILRGRISLYEGRGDFQVIAEHLEPAGDGLLRQQFEALKEKLQTEGLFAPENKKPLPSFPKRIGIITSPSGAAVRDVISVLGRRCPMIPVLIYPSPVQGENAPEELINAINLARSRKECDVLIICRGGGSIEDLWAFNDEKLARTISACDIPVVSGVGHEIDFTITDFVSDLRAPTPSAAAESVAPDLSDLTSHLHQLLFRLSNATRKEILTQKEKLSWVEKRLFQQQPKRRIEADSQKLDHLEHRLISAIKSSMNQKQKQYTQLNNRLSRQSPQLRLNGLNQHLNYLRKTMINAISQQVKNSRNQLSGLVRALDGVSPLQTLGRGYAAVTIGSSRKTVNKADSLKCGDKVTTWLAQGALECEVTDVKPDAQLIEGPDK